MRSFQHKLKKWSWNPKHSRRVHQSRSSHIRMHQTARNNKNRPRRSRRAGKDFIEQQLSEGAVLQQELLKKISSMSKTPLTCRLKQIKERLEKYGYLTSDEGPKDNIEIKDFWKNGITLMLQPKHNSAAAKTQFQIEWLENSKRILGSLSGLWLKKGIVTRAIEKLILSIQEGRAATKFFCKMIGTAKDNRCRHCKVAPETTDHILGGRAGFLRHLYKTRHDSFVQSIVNKLLSWFKLGKKATRLDELLRSKIKNEKVEIKVDCRVNLNKASLYNFPGVVIVYHEQKKVSIIEVVYARPSSNNQESG